MRKQKDTGALQAQLGIVGMERDLRVESVGQLVQTAVRTSQAGRRHDEAHESERCEEPHEGTLPRLVPTRQGKSSRGETRSKPG